MFATIETRPGHAIRKMAANQNSAIASHQICASAPQWYDVKLLVEQMFDARSRVRDAIEMRRASEMVSVRVMNACRTIGGGLQGHDMEIAVRWHAYRRTSAAYHRAWAIYQKNMGRK
jgi:hypothetical protein